MYSWADAYIATALSRSMKTFVMFAVTACHKIKRRRLCDDRRVSTLTNIVFLASLSFTGYYLLRHRNTSFHLPTTLAIASNAPMLIRILAEHLANRKYIEIT